MSGVSVRATRACDLGLSRSHDHWNAGDGGHPATAGDTKNGEQNVDIEPDDRE